VRCRCQSVFSGSQDIWDWDTDAPYATMHGAISAFHTLGAKNPRVKFIAINGGGHFVYREQPEQFNADLIRFVEFWNNNPVP
jgi:pimeloyl-ACP methyl ester carboxylesterase